MSGIMATSPATPLVLIAATLVALLAAAAPAAEERVEWKLSGSDLALWRVSELGAEGDEEPPRPRPRAAMLGIYGYQIDRRGAARFPVHRIDEIPYDLALRVPVGKVREGSRSREIVVYDSIRDHAPLQLEVELEVVAEWDDRIRVEGSARAIEAPAFDRRLRPGQLHRTDALSATLTLVFDRAMGVVTSASVRQTSTISHRDPPQGADAPPPPTTASLALAFELERIREYAPDRLLPAIGSAIDRGVEHLRSSIHADGTYGAHGNYPDGETCLALLTLLVCGAERDDPFILELANRVRGFELTTTYEIGIALMAIEALHAPADEVTEVHAGRRALPLRRDVSVADLAWMEEKVGKLLAIADRKPEGLGWGYHLQERRPDLSNGQYAALGLLAAWRCGVSVPEDTWVELARGVFAHRPEGERAPLDLTRKGEEIPTTSAGRPVEARGFTYSRGASQPTASMTSGGICMLRIARDVLRLEKSRHSRGRLGKEIDKAVQGAWAWLGASWVIQRHAPWRGREWQLYYLYALERAGVLCSVEAVNGRDWYSEGAAWLVHTQEENGSWRDGGGGFHQTCFALLFLKRGTIPVTSGE
jgi:hypothetical protein